MPAAVTRGTVRAQRMQMFPRTSLQTVPGGVGLIVGENELGPLDPAAFSVGEGIGIGMEPEGDGVTDSDCEGGVEGASGDLVDPQAESVAIPAIAAPPARSARGRVKRPELMAVLLSSEWGLTSSLVRTRDWGAGSGGGEALTLVGAIAERFLLGVAAPAEKALGGLLDQASVGREDLDLAAHFQRTVGQGLDGDGGIVLRIAHGEIVPAVNAPRVK